MVVIGIGGLIGGAYYTMERIDFLSKAIQTRAEIIDTFWDVDHDSQFPVFQFVDLNGVERTARGYVGGLYSASDIGKEVDIYYDPENPANAVVSSFLDTWSVPIVLLGFGFIFVFIGGFALLKYDVIGDRFYPAPG